MSDGQSRDVDFSILADAEALGTLRLDRLYRDWRQAAGEGGGLPGLAFLAQPRDFLEGQEILLRVDPGEPQPRFFYMEIGARLVAISGRNLTGSYVDQHPESAFAQVAMRACSLAVETRRPIHARLRRQMKAGDFIVEYLMLPVGDAAGTVIRLFVAQIYTPL